MKIKHVSLTYYLQGDRFNAKVKSNKIKCNFRPNYRTFLHGSFNSILSLNTYAFLTELIKTDFSHYPLEYFKMCRQVCKLLDCLWVYFSFLILFLQILCTEDE